MIYDFISHCISDLNFPTSTHIKHLCVCMYLFNIFSIFDFISHCIQALSFPNLIHEALTCVCMYIISIFIIDDFIPTIFHIETSVI